MAKKKDIVDRKIKKELAFKLKALDKAELLGQAEKLDTARDEIKSQLDKIKSEYKGRIDKISLQIKQIYKWSRDGERREVVDCIERKDFNKRTVSYVYDGAVVESRDMNPDELQTEMPIETPKRMVRNPADGEVSEVIKMETKRATKKSSLDVPVN